MNCVPTKVSGLGGGNGFSSVVRTYITTTWKTILMLGQNYSPWQEHQQSLSEQWPKPQWPEQHNYSRCMVVEARKTNSPCQKANHLKLLFLWGIFQFLQMMHSSLNHV